MTNRLLLVFLTLSLAGCVPSYMKRLTKRGESPRTAPGEPSADVRYKTPKKRRGLFNRSKSKPTPRSPSVYAVDGQTYRFKKNRHDVWDSTVTVLLKNYNLTIANEESGIITTEWDKFVLNDNYYRNKVSIRVQPINSNLTEVAIHNAVEKLQSPAETRIPGAGSIWLPSEDVANELHRLVQNVSVVMSLEPPSGIKSKLARDQTRD